MSTQISVYTACSDIMEEGYDQIPPNVVGAVLDGYSLPKAILQAYQQHYSYKLNMFYNYASTPYGSGGYYYGLPTGPTLKIATNWQVPALNKAATYSASLSYDQVTTSNAAITLRYADVESWDTLEPTYRREFILAQLHNDYFIDESQGDVVDVYAYEYDGAGKVVQPTQPKLFHAVLQYLQVITTVDISNASNAYDTFGLSITNIPFAVPVNVNRLSNNYLFMKYDMQYVDNGVTKTKRMTSVTFNVTPLTHVGIITNVASTPFDYYPMIPQAVNRDWILDSFDTGQVKSVDYALRILGLEAKDIKSSIVGQDGALDDDTRDVGIFIGCKPRSTNQAELGLVYEFLLDYHNYKSTPGHLFGGNTNFNIDLGVSEVDLQNPDYSLRDITYKPATIVGGYTLDIKLLGLEIHVAESPFDIRYTKDRSLLFTTVFTGNTSTYTITEDTYNNLTSSIYGVTGNIHTVYTIQFDDSYNGVTKKLVFYNLLQKSAVHVTEGIIDYLYHTSSVTTHSTGEGSSSFALPVLRSSIMNADNRKQREQRASISIKILVNLANIQHLSAWEDFISSSFFSFILDVIQIASIIITVITLGTLTVGQAIVHLVKQYIYKQIVRYLISELGDLGTFLSVIATYYIGTSGAGLGNTVFNLEGLSFGDKALRAVEAVQYSSNIRTELGYEQLSEDSKEFQKYVEERTKEIEDVQELLGDTSPQDALFSATIVKSSVADTSGNRGEQYDTFFSRTLDEDAGLVLVDSPAFLIESLLTLPEFIK